MKARRFRWHLHRVAKAMAFARVPDTAIKGCVPPPQTELARLVADYVAGMTDRCALQAGQRLLR
ncbi:MAG: hypothetical protein CFE33_07280 [Pseudorhodobacter sp. PARRP1]|nr:MAG: hypothetical protein CFE33_07280 [Pseudorhodobacter sp. PARRP1]